MMDQSQLQIIRDHPLGAHLNSVRTSLNESIQSSAELETVSRQVLRGLALDLLPSLQNHPAARFLSSETSHDTLREDILKLMLAVASNPISISQIKPLLSAVLAVPHRSDVEIWEQVYHAVAETTPPRRPVSSFPQTPSVQKTSSIVNSSELRANIDKLLGDELGGMYVDVPNFHDAFFGHIPDLKTASEEIFRKCMEEEDRGGEEEAQPLFREGWTGWPETASEAGVLTWLAGLVERLVRWAQHYRPTTRRPLAQPNTPLKGSVAKRKLDVGFVDDPKASKDTKHNWSHILVPGELKRNPKEDTRSRAWLDLGRYVKEVFTAQPRRRFVLAFTLCGSWMRLWEFDRLGAIASTKFNIHKEGQLFVSAMLGFLWMDDKSLGFDPTVKKSDNQQYVDIEQNGTTKRLIIDGLIKRMPGVVGRATTCWKAHPEGEQSTPLVIKDSWQYPEREEEGIMFQETTAKQVTNLARYYHHETVRVGNEDDDIKGNVRKGLDVTKASNYGKEYLSVSSQARASSTGSKRSASQIGAPQPPDKRSRSGSASPTKPESPARPNRIHRRVILRDYGKLIYKASSRVALLKALEGCIEGHESLHAAGILHRDISVNNLMINEDNDNPSWSSFLIDLDLAIKVDRSKASGARGMTGTRAFIAIGVLLGEDHSFMDDLESFFWVLFWICIHYDERGQGQEVIDFDEWNYMGPAKLAKEKLGTVSKKSVFRDTASAFFSAYYRPLIPWVVKMRDVVFPKGVNWEEKDERLYSQMRDILREAQNDPLVAAADQ